MNLTKLTKILALAIAATPVHSFAQDKLSDSRKQLGEFLTTLAARESQIGRIRIDDVKDSANTLYFTASDNCSYISFNEENVKEVYSKLYTFLPEEYSKYKTVIYTDGHEISEYVPLALRTAKSKTERFTRPNQTPLVTNISQISVPDRGLQGKHIVIWPSHGRYYEPKLTRWEWQRARMFMTVEDLYTRSYVMPFLVPMLENAGANVLIPRERDTQSEEIIVDNDKGIDSGSRYTETNGKEAWANGQGKGFAHLRGTYKNFENPFLDGSYRITATTTGKDSSSISWTPQINQAGEYAVYVSYHTVENSTEDASYTIYHNGSTTSFSVNQTMGGGTWVYLGTFNFAAGCSEANRVVLSNRSNKRGKAITADAVRFGGGMGNIARSNSPSDTLHRNYPAITSTYPRYTEGARYYMQWAGVPDSVYSPTQGKDDYTDDYINRGLWVNYMAGGSSVNPNEKGLNIPVDLSFAFHTDAGTYKDNRTVGSLAIYSTKGDDGKFYNGSSKFLSHDLCELIQSNIVNDIRKIYLPQWSRRGKWNKPYYEAWEPKVPTMLLELLSHQNFADMRYGLDPRFRFTVSRAIYKGMLQFMASQYGKQYVVQPLPVTHFAIQFTPSSAQEIDLSWRATTDSLEPTAEPDYYIVYTRVGNADFDNGTKVKGTSWQTTIPAGKICSFKVTAVNRGGESFPSEILSAALSNESISSTKPQNTKQNAVLVVNNFTRVSAPTDFTAPAPADTALAGFLCEEDHGVPYIKDFSYIGDMKNFNRSEPWHDDDSGGFGDSYGNYENKLIAGNTFDFPACHGEAILAAGMSFVSCSADAIADSIVDMAHYPAVDLILGKQRQCKMGNGGYYPVSFKTFPQRVQQAITAYTRQGGNIFVSGAYVASDLWCNPVSPSLKEDRDFAQSTLHYKWRNSRAARNGDISCVTSKFDFFSGQFKYHNILNDKSYAVESPDGIEPADDQAATIMRYTENNLSAAVAWSGDYKTVVLGFPFESVTEKAYRESLMKQILNFFGLTL
jgi:hypothetical protein